jgi:galactitol 2-dehydrogenase
MKRLDGRTALITGAARGIGLTFAQAYAREGARVAIADIDLARAEASARAIGDAAIAVRMDVTDRDSIAAGITDAETRLRGIDILVNNAAIFDAAPITEITPESYARVFAVNVHGVLFTTQAVAKGKIAMPTRSSAVPIRP